MYLQKAIYRPCDLDLYPVQVNILVHCKYPVYISDRYLF